MSKSDLAQVIITLPSHHSRARANGSRLIQRGPRRLAVRGNLCRRSHRVDRQGATRRLGKRHHNYDMPSCSYSHWLLTAHQAYTPYSRFFGPASSAQHRQLRQDILKLRAELAATSSQDEFSKWARIRRKLDKAVGQLDAASELLLQRAHLVTRRRDDELTPLETDRHDFKRCQAVFCIHVQRRLVDLDNRLAVHHHVVAPQRGRLLFATGLVWPRDMVARPAISSHRCACCVSFDSNF